MYKQDLALNNLQLLICHKTQPTNFKNSYPIIYIFIVIFETMSKNTLFFFIFRFIKPPKIKSIGCGFPAE